MKYPAEIKIGANIIPITIRTEPLEVRNQLEAVIGRYYPLTREMELYHNDDMADMCGENFVHETIEAANALNDLKLNHTQITTLATSLYQAYSYGGVSFGGVTH